MRRHRPGTPTFAKSNAAPVPDALSLIRSFNSETNPTRPIRPSPLTASTIHGIPLDTYDRIRAFPLFASAPDEFLAAIGKHLRPQSNAPHDTILTEGDDAKAMYWLVRGAVAVTSRDGESTYAELKPGAFFGEIGILMSIPRTATIVARTKCLLVVLKKEDLAKELPNFPDVERAIRDEASERLSILNRKKQEKQASGQLDPTTSGRGEKRARDGEDGDIIMSDGEDRRQNGVQTHKKRKSPSPSLIEAAASSALGDGLVNVRQLLKELPLFSGLPPDLLHFLGLNAQPCTYPPFTDIIQQDSQGREVFFIVRGEVEVIDEKANGQNLRSLANGAGRNIKRGSQVKARLKQGQYFGEIVSLSLTPRRTATVRSVTSVECLMITGDVLSNFWLKCPPDVRQQVEKTARQRLKSGSDGDVIMTDVDSTPPIAQLAIAERNKPKGRKKSVPKVTFSPTQTQTQTHTKPETPHKPSRIEDRPVIEPADPDPFMNVDLDKSFNRSRRSSLAPPLPEGEEAHNADQSGQRASPPTPRAATPTKKSRHSDTPLDIRQKPKRPNNLQRRPSEFSQGLLPDSVLISIFMHLELHHLMRLRLVSLHWSKLLKETPELVRELNLTPYNRIVTDEILVNRICPFVGARPRIIDISNCFHISDEGFSALSNVCGANVTTWRMKSVWDITAQAVLEMANKAKCLEEVDLSNCRKVSDNLLQRVVGWVVQGSPQNTNHGRHAAARSVGAPVPNHPPPGTVFGCPKLRILTLSYCKHVTDRSMAHMAYHAASRLEQIDLTRCTTITDSGFQHWGQFQFTRLTKLCLADCTYLTDNAIVYLTNAAKGLRDLDLVRQNQSISANLITPVLTTPPVLLLRPLRHRHRSPLPRLSPTPQTQPLLLR